MPAMRDLRASPSFVCSGQPVGTLHLTIHESRLAFQGICTCLLALRLRNHAPVLRSGVSSGSAATMSLSFETLDFRKHRTP